MAYDTAVATSHAGPGPLLPLTLFVARRSVATATISPPSTFWLIVNLFFQ
jgi:hypothetical protein